MQARDLGLQACPGRARIGAGSLVLSGRPGARIGSEAGGGGTGAGPGLESDGSC